jgi:alginate O-acetyltransferase complex protein AlgI
MLFPTIDFAVFFLVAFTANWLLRPYKVPYRVAMTALSIYFYAYWNPRYAVLIGVSIVGNWAFAWGAGRSLGPNGQKTPTSRSLVATAVVFNLLALGYFKYFSFAVDSLYNFFNALPVSDANPPLIEVLLPVGISFFTFQAMSYVIDVGRDDMERMPFLDFAMYVSFFPQLVAGPIVRAVEFEPQLKHQPDPRHLRYAEAFRLIFAGLFKKVVISGYLAAQIVDPVFANPHLQSSRNLLFAIYGYAIQIYADFSGYTDIAIGCALLLGFRFPQNFNAPYIARSLQDFWRRWHMTLSRWLRDYLYIPLGGNRGSTGFVYRNLMLTMVLGGLWHGAAWNFVIWGTLHGVALVAERARRAWAVALVAMALMGPLALAGVAFSWNVSTLIGVVFVGAIVTLLTWGAAQLEVFESGTVAGGGIKFVRWLVTFNVVCLAWVFFRSQTLADALTVLNRLFTAGGAGTFVTWVVVAVIVGSILSQLVPAAWVDRVQVVYSRMGFALQLLLLIGGLTLIDVLGPAGIDPFIYFQF